MSPEILTFGEPLIEFSAAEEGNLHNNNLFIQGFGGDTSNFAISAARSGIQKERGRVGYITSIGTDPFGRMLMDLWKKEGIDVSFVEQTDKYKTGIYFISRRNGNHEFTYFRKGSAASRMTPEILPVEKIQQTKVLHLSGITQGISKSARDTSAKALDIANDSKVRVSYDPNLRTGLWHIDEAREIVHATVPRVDLLFPSYEDACLLTKLDSPEEIADFYLHMGAKVVVLKLGQKGALLADGTKMTHFDPYVVKEVDASGAGDTFCGAFAAEMINGASLEECARFAGTAAALSTTGIGCVAPIPKRKEVLAAMEKMKL